MEGLQATWCNRWIVRWQAESSRTGRCAAPMNPVKWIIGMANDARVEMEEDMQRFLPVARYWRFGGATSGSLNDTRSGAHLSLNDALAGISASFPPNIQK